MSARPRQAERAAQAEIYVRLVLWEQAIGRISQATQSRVYSILSFVMPAVGAFADDSVPMQQLEREADWETAYHEQLRRQICADCGDGLCPVEDDRRPPISYTTAAEIAANAITKAVSLVRLGGLADKVFRSLLATQY